MEDSRPVGDQSDPVSTGGASTSRGSFFPNAQHFIVSGGAFSITNVNHAITTSNSSSAFRLISMGDLDLHRECKNAPGDAPHFQETRGFVRRIYSARVRGCKTMMTVALYRGDDAKDQWRQEISRCSWLRHPNFLQLFGTASTRGLHAAIFHDEFIPAQETLLIHSHSPVSTVYLWGYFEQEFADAWQYLYSVSGVELDSFSCTMGIRPSTGRLCIDLTPPNSLCGSPYLFYSPWQTSFRNLKYSRGLKDSTIISSILLDHYHKICFLYLSRFRHIQVSTRASVDLGSILSCRVGSTFADVFNVASIRGLAYQDSGWLPELSELEHNLVEVGGGWVRLESEHVEQIEEIFRKIYCGASEFAFWLTQANHVFDRLKVTAGHENYVFVHSIEYRLMISGDATIPQGYLFLCPLAELQSGLPTRMCLPACPAYWSLDPSGVEGLSTEEAERLGFPAIELIMEVQGMYLMGSVYSGLRQLYQGKGFDAYSQDVARELGYPLYQMSEQFASRVEEQDESCGDDNSESASTETECIIAPDDADLSANTELVPSTGWTIVMSVQVALMLTLGMLRLYSCLCAARA